MGILQKKLLSKFDVFKRFKRDEKGVTAIEFALVGPIFISLILAIFEVGFVYMLDLNLEHGLANTARLVRTGQLTNAQTEAGTINAMRTDICRVLGTSLPNCETKLHLEATSVADFGDVTRNPTNPNFDNNGNATNSTANIGGAGTISVIRATVRWDVLANFPVVGLANNPDGSYQTTAVAVVRIEGG